MDLEAAVKEVKSGYIDSNDIQKSIKEIKDLKSKKPYFNE